MIKGREGDGGETSKSQIDFESINRNKSQPLPSDPSKATPQTQKHTLPDYRWKTGRRESIGERRIVAIANRIQLLYPTISILTTVKTQINYIVKWPVQTQYRLTKDKYPQTTLALN